MGVIRSETRQNLNAKRITFFVVQLNKPDSTSILKLVAVMLQLQIIFRLIVLYFTVSWLVMVSGKRHAVLRD